MENFSSLATQLVREGGASQVCNAAELELTLHELLSHAEKRAELASNAARILEIHHGATARTWRALEHFESLGVVPVS